MKKALIIGAIIIAILIVIGIASPGGRDSFQQGMDQAKQDMEAK